MSTSLLDHGSATMRPKARLISIIGNDLISDEPVALVELVKNSYDADATFVEIRFEVDENNNPLRIVIEDDGIGMNLETVLNGWFEPGTNLKTTGTRSEKGRLMLGAKGIGRFAAARLADTLYLDTTSQESNDNVTVLLNWGNFDNESYLDDITIDYEVRHKHNKQHGTVLILDGLRKKWEPTDFERLYTRLARLISPFNEIIDFNISLVIPGFPDFSGDVEPHTLLKRPIYRLVCSIADGCMSGNIYHDEELVRKFTSFNLTPSLKKVVDFSCGPFELEIRAWDRDKEGLKPYTDLFSISVSQFRKVLNDYCGVNIYRDGFRVYPYGEKGNDWLGLDARSRQNPPKHLANNQIVAAIRISSTSNPSLEDRSTREGMILNTSHSALEAFFIAALHLLEGERYKIRPRKKTQDIREPLFEGFDLEDELTNAKQELGKDHNVTKAIKEANARIKEGVESVQATLENLISLAGVGHLVDVVLHEIGSPLGTIDIKLAKISKLLSSIDHRDVPKINSSLEDVYASLSRIRSLRKRLDPQTPGKRGTASTFNPCDEIENCIELFSYIISKHKIDLQFIHSSDFKVKMSRAAFSHIVINLMDNSIFWVSRSDSNDRKILVELTEIDSGFAISVADSGPGVDEDIRDLIFDPYYSNKPNGMGLGLYISRIVIEPYGKLLLVDNDKLGGACFLALFERSVGK